MGAVRLGSHRRFSSGEPYHRRHSDLRDQACHSNLRKTSPVVFFCLFVFAQQEVVVALHSDQMVGVKQGDGVVDISTILLMIVFFHHSTN